MGFTTLAPQSYALLGDLVIWGVQNQASVSQLGLTEPILDQLWEDSFSRAPISPRMATNAFMLSFAASRGPLVVDRGQFNLMADLIPIAGEHQIIEHAMTLPIYPKIAHQFCGLYSFAASMYGSSISHFPPTSRFADISEPIFEEPDVPAEELMAQFPSGADLDFWRTVAAEMDKENDTEFPLTMHIRKRPYRYQE